MKMARVIGTLGFLGGILYFILLVFYDPYSNEPLATDTLVGMAIMYLLPTIIALYSIVFTKPKLLILCAICASPAGLYALGGNGIFNWLIMPPLL
ncbi:hypothetical protein [Neobacillus drentensis]|uniref:hypothetical protein n=1 Tax=Neobacillus drentensis TaxID=220684 RepID=UPI0030010BDA